MTLVAIGACYLDTILTAPYYPGEDEKLRASRISRRRGGNCPNTLEVLGQLLQYGPSSAESSLNLIAVLPSKSSVPCQQIQSSLGNMVRLDRCIYREGFSEPASSYIITSQATGSRTIVNYNELPEMTRTEFVTAVEPLRAVTDRPWFHFEGRAPDVTLECIRYLREYFPGAKISVEVEKPGRPGLQELADVADVVIYSKGWAQSNGYTSAEDCLRDQSLKTSRASLLCCTWGSDGAAALEPKIGNFAHVPAHTEEAGVVDTIGAGDTFNAGLLYGLIYRGRDWGFRKKLEFANLIAGLKVTQEGFTELQRALNVP
ncbi:hypothetical protein N7489_009967 [Penicillium chrysogenum]|uniref:Carbohydrate kinase PfkB domain-containing protein n=1 Tax=Penicillium chrysogenum TaxID=5076 RepID=A0ABQ8WVX9_PENCH|nr:uncharacterized protein N7489_009967 [Penicillium chrysogenum]KAJ5229259.1 hypothetical protein N7489_009967 [Penicillium chrysogenum]KAJ5258663.1 hypothetical protein N7524_010219 [Penicillium chrysogenum]KAJ5282861.1 hypothetical protein N7505_000841 [Penicillium chrysogenum]KAJ6169135.1 hypothetical protein N7497_001978 [Penicillium chrysogenum]